jgi:hypothetical protein
MGAGRQKGSAEEAGPNAPEEKGLLEEPSTPGRSEQGSAGAARFQFHDAVPGLQQGQQSSPNGEAAVLDGAAAAAAAAYDSMYEETNRLLKNLHFQRLRRSAAAPISPEGGGAGDGSFLAAASAVQAAPEE